MPMKWDLWQSRDSLEIKKTDFQQCEQLMYSFSIRSDVILCKDWIYFGRIRYQIPLI